MKGDKIMPTVSLEKANWLRLCLGGARRGDANVLFGAVGGRRRHNGLLSCVYLLLLGCAAGGDPPFELGNGEGNGGGTGNSGGDSNYANPRNTGGTLPSTGTTIVINTTGTQPAPGTTDSQTNCGSIQVDAEIKTIETVVETPGNVLFVFDQSSSMDETWQGQQKWRAAYGAVVAAFTPVQDKLNAGAVLYPATTAADAAAASACDPTVDLLGCILGAVNVCPDVAPITEPPQIGFQSGQAFLTAWNTYWSKGAAALGMGTPTEKALLAGESALAAPPPGNTALVLVTDGAPTCGSNESAVAARLLTKNIKTYVVGLPGVSGAANLLDKIAIAGGTALAGCTSNCYLTPATGADFQKSLAGIASTVVSTTTEVSIVDCTFRLSPPTDASANAKEVHLVVTELASGQQFEVPNGPDSWTLSADAMTATLQGSVCSAAKAGVFSGLSFQYGCVTVPEWSPLL
jgi:hypothetical protein